jgi:hypothetical protein
MKMEVNDESGLHHRRRRRGRVFRKKTFLLVAGLGGQLVSGFKPAASSPIILNKELYFSQLPRLSIRCSSSTRFTARVFLSGVAREMHLNIGERGRRSFSRLGQDPPSKAAPNRINRCHISISVYFSPFCGLNPLDNMEPAPSSPFD